MSEQMELQPLGDESYSILLIDNPDGGIGIFVKVNIGIIQEYARRSVETLIEAGYTGDHKQFAQDIALAYYALTCCQSETPRTVFWQDDDKDQVLKKLKDVIAHQRWGKTINQLPKIGDAFDSLDTGVIRDDPIGYARGMALRELISATYERGDKPIVYFDSMRHYPIEYERLFDILEHFEISPEDMQRFDPDFYNYFSERLNAVVDVLTPKKPGAEPWESWPLDENPIRQKYQQDWDDYELWLDKNRGKITKPKKFLRPVL
jgi:hypothetical protein